MPWDMRDALRNNCFNLVAQSSLNRRDKPLLPHKYALIAYHLAAKTLKVKKAQDLKTLMEEEPHLFSGDRRTCCRSCDRFTVLACPRTLACERARCSTSSMTTMCSARIRETRCRTSSTCVRCRTVGDSTSFVRRFSEFKLLHDKLQKELLVVPGFPPADVSYKVRVWEIIQREARLCVAMLAESTRRSAREACSRRDSWLF